MGYRVCGAAAVVEFNDDNPDQLNTGTKVYLEENGVLPDGVKDKCIEHLLQVGLIEKTDDGHARKSAAAKADD